MQDNDVDEYIGEIQHESNPEDNKSILGLRSHNNDLKKVCLQCNGTGVMGNEEINAECDSCLGTGKPIIKS